VSPEPGQTEPGQTEPGQPPPDQTSAHQPGAPPHPGHHPGPRKLSLVVYSGAFSRVHYALVLASAAAAVGTPATLFFTMDAARFLQKPRADGTPGWRSVPAVGPGISPAFSPAAAAIAEAARGAPAGEDATSAGAVDDVYAGRGVATFEELLLACAALGVTFMVCEMGLRVIGLEASALRADLRIAEGGVVSFLADASEHGAMLFI
jgi:peroxiredoxin family protein